MLISLIQRLGKNRIYIAVVALVVALTFVQWVMRLIIFERLQKPETNKELFNLDLESLNSMESLSRYIDSASQVEGIVRESQEKYVTMIDDIIRERFYHGESHISFSNNFIAWFSGRLIWGDFYVGVTPDEILSHPNALCSQSAIVFQEIVKMKGFKVRAIGLKRHFCSEVFYEGSWHFMDSDKEPAFSDNRPIPSVEELSQDKELINKAYVRDSENVSLEQMSDIFNGDEILFYNENEFPAKKMHFFQTITKLLSDFLWLILLLPIILSLFTKRAA